MSSVPTLAPLAWFVDSFDPVILHVWGPLAVHWYGVAYICGFVAGLILWVRASKTGRTGLDVETLQELFTWEVAGVLVGGRLGFMLLYDLPHFLSDPISIIRVYEGGMSFHGGLIGVTAAVLIFSWRRGVSPWHIGDLAAAAAPLGLFFGRLANFVNGELWGNITTVRWAMIFPKAPHIATEATVYYETALGSGYANPRHPSTLYEAALEGIVLGTILIWLFWRKNGALPKALPGLLSGLFLILYAAARMFCERFREPDAGLILGLSRGTFYSIFMIVAGAGIIIFALFRGRHPPLRDSHPENDNTNV